MCVLTCQRFCAAHALFLGPCVCSQHAFPVKGQGDPFPHLKK